MGQLNGDSVSKGQSSYAFRTILVNGASPWIIQITDTTNAMIPVLIFVVWPACIKLKQYCKI